MHKYCPTTGIISHFLEKRQESQKFSRLKKLIPMNIASSDTRGNYKWSSCWNRLLEGQLSDVHVRHEKCSSISLDVQRVQQFENFIFIWTSKHAKETVHYRLLTVLPMYTSVQYSSYFITGDKVLPRYLASLISYKVGYLNLYRMNSIVGHCQSFI